MRFSSYVYCAPDEGRRFGCFIQALHDGKEHSSTLEYFDKGQLQEAIAQGRILHYGALERIMHR